MLWGLRELVTAAGGSQFDSIRGLYFIVLGLVVNLPYQKLSERVWKGAFALLCILAAGFVFVMVVAVMFAYMEHAERGEKLGVLASRAV